MIDEATLDGLGLNYDSEAADNNKVDEKAKNGENNSSGKNHCHRY